MDTQLSVGFGTSAEAAPAPRLEEDSRDASLKSPVVVNPMDFGYIWAPLWAAQGELRRKDLWPRLLQPVQPGVVAVRLYGDMNDGWEFHLSDPRREGLARSGYASWPLAGTAAATGEILDQGILIDTITETLNFSGSARVSLSRRPEGLPTVLYASSFYDARGVEVKECPEPDARAPWNLVARTEVVGGLTVRYTTCSRRLIIHYGLPEGPVLDTMKELWVSGGLESFEIPPVTLFAVGRHGCAQCDVRRDLWPRSMPGIAYSMKNAGNTDEKKAFTLTETGRTTATKRVYDPNDKETYLDVAYATRLSLSDPEGKRWELNLKSGT